MHLITHRITKFLILLVSLAVCVSAGSTIWDLWQRRNLVRSREIDLQTVSRENQKLTKELQDTQTTGYVERIARDKLGMVKDGEAIVLLPPNASQAAPESGVDAVPNWQRWWKLFN